MVFSSVLALVAILSFNGCASTGSSTTTTGVKPYPLKTCIVMDEKLDKDAIAFVYQGQQIKICCEGCKEDFDKDPQAYLKKLAGK